MGKNIFVMSLLLSTMGLAPVLAHSDNANASMAYRCVVDMDIKAPDSLARGDIDSETPGPLADVTLAADSNSASQILASVKSDNNDGSPATSNLELSIFRQGDQIQVVVETVISGQGLQKEIPHISVDFMNGNDPQFITHGFIPREAGINEQVTTKKKRFFGFGEKTIISSEEMKFSDAAYFDPLAGVDLQCALKK